MFAGAEHDDVTPDTMLYRLMRPHPVELSQPQTPKLSVVLRILLTTSVLVERPMVQRRAAAPATKGEANEVPDPEA